MFNLLFVRFCSVLFVSIYSAIIGICLLFLRFSSFSFGVIHLTNIIINVALVYSTDALSLLREVRKWMPGNMEAKYPAGRSASFMDHPPLRTTVPALQLQVWLLLPVVYAFS